MPILSDARLGSFGNFYTHFEGCFPTQEDRHAAACELAGPDPADPPDILHPSHNVLATHWAEPNDELVRRADYIFRLKGIINISTRLPVLVFTRGTPEDILDPDEEDLSDDVEATFGLVHKEDYEISFGGNVTETGKHRMGIPPPNLGFRVQVPVEDAHGISVDALDRVAHLQPHQSQVQRLTVYAGAVSLRKSERHYLRTRQLCEPHVVAGHTVCHRVLNALAEKTIGKDRRPMTQLINI